MRILHIIDSLGLGGAQTVVKGIFEYQQNNSDIFLFALRNRDILMEVKNSNVQIFNSSEKYSFKPLFALRDLIKRERITVLHCHLFRSQIFGFLLKKIWFKDIELIFHEHGRIFQDRIIYNLFLRISRNYVDKIIAVSNATKDKLIAKAGIKENRVSVLPNFVDLNKFNIKNITWKLEEEKNKLGIKEGEFVIGFVGRLAKVKGCEYLIKALPYLDFCYKVLIVGDGLERKKIEKLAIKLKVADKILFLGYRNDTVFIYSLLDMLVVPSRSESFGLAIIEAQSMGASVLSANIPALSEIITKDNNGLLFESKHFIDLAEKIKFLYDNKDIRYRLVQNGLESVKKYDLGDYINNLNKIYEDIK